MSHYNLQRKKLIPVSLLSCCNTSIVPGETLVTVITKQIIT